MDWTAEGRQRKSRRASAGLLCLLAFSSPAYGEGPAAAADKDSFEAGPWDGIAIYRQDDQLAECTIFQDFKTTQLSLALNPEGHFVIGVTDESEALEKQGAVSARFQVDGALERRALGRRIGSALYFTFIRDWQLFAALGRGRTLGIDGTTTARHFGLRGSLTGLRALFDCVRERGPERLAFANPLGEGPNRNSDGSLGARRVAVSQPAIRHPVDPSDLGQIESILATSGLDDPRFIRKKDLGSRSYSALLGWNSASRPDLLGLISVVPYFSEETTLYNFAEGIGGKCGGDFKVVFNQVVRAEDSSVGQARARCSDENHGYQVDVVMSFTRGEALTFAHISGVESQAEVSDISDKLMASLRQ